MIRVGVIRGGISQEYEQSLATGAVVLSALRTLHAGTYEAVDILITRDGRWHIAGVPISRDALRARIDVAWNALHGEYGQDGQVLAFLDELGIPHTGGSAFTHALTSDTQLVKKGLESLGIHTPRIHVIPDVRTKEAVPPEVYFKEAAQDVFLKFSPPWIVYPAGVNARAGFSIARTREELLNAIRTASNFPGDVIVEEYIKGRSMRMVLASDFRTEPIYAFLPLEGEPYTATVRPYDARAFPQTIREQATAIAKKAYTHFGLGHVAHIDLIITPKEIYVRDIHTAPVLGEESAIHQSLHAVGSHMGEFVEHGINLAFKNKA